MHRSFIAYCGHDCAPCQARLATEKDDLEALKAIAASWSRQMGREIAPEEARCNGCRIGGAFLELCPVWRCASTKVFGSCGACGDYPCHDLKEILDVYPERVEALERVRRGGEGPGNGQTTCCERSH